MASLRRPIIPAESAVSRPGRYAVASRALTRRHRPRDGSYRGDGGEAGHGVGASQPKVAVQLAPATNGISRSRADARHRSSGNKDAGTAPLPKLTVRRMRQVHERELV